MLEIIAEKFVNTFILYMNKFDGLYWYVFCWNSFWKIEGTPQLDDDGFYEWTTYDFYVSD